MGLDSTCLLEKLEHVMQSVKRPNVLITGPSGAGKSSIINAVFGRALAESGVGKPITQHYTLFSPEDQPVAVYDSKGLEHGKSDEFIAETQMFIQQHSAKAGSDDIENHIHVVWYVLNLGTARFQDFDAYLCREVFAGLPLVFLLNKRDLVEPSVVDAITSEIESLHLANCCGIYPVSAQPKADMSQVPDCCPECGSENLLINKKNLTYSCDMHHTFEILTPDTGLDQVVQSTIHALPDWAVQSFAEAQRVSVLVKVEAAKRIVRHHFKRAKVMWNKARLRDEYLDMTFQLGRLWAFLPYDRDQHDESIHTANAALLDVESNHAVPPTKQYMSFMRRLQEVVMDLLEDVTESQARLGAEGILMYRAFAEAYVSAANRVLQDANHSTQQNKGAVVSADFSAPDSATVEALKESIKNEGIDQAFDNFLERLYATRKGTTTAPVPSPSSDWVAPNLSAPLVMPSRTSTAEDDERIGSRRSLPMSKGWFIRFRKTVAKQNNLVNLHFGFDLSECPSFALVCSAANAAPFPASETPHVPIVFDRLVTHLRSVEAWKTEGVFRVPASHQAVVGLCQKINRSGYNIGTVPECSVHEAAAVLKHWLRQLPSPLIALELHAFCLECQVNKSYAELMQRLAIDLAATTRLVLTRLVQLLSEISKHAAINKMTGYNLAVCFAPDVLRGDESDLATVMHDMPITIELLAHMIDNFDSLFQPFVAYFM
eukprot:c106_g1_i1.p1 GENE.c106_g1_i1~~c106_g1_i1.p1  ORF type:complete len:715 (-),score=171.55 c106_g1_i1:70-2214(-)